eukprot:augustus_masked-scaffold_15-processed-gene-5.47-mRNA-1 protein AED:0.07 eAED:0.77 QI:0/-1/0/1/-1/1/1/0/383
MTKKFYDPQIPEENPPSNIQEEPLLALPSKHPEELDVDAKVSLNMEESKVTKKQKRKRLDTENTESDGKKKRKLEQCGICLDNISTRGVLNSCDHLFCFSCIVRWSKRSSTCPHCKRAITNIKKNDEVFKVKKKNLRDTLDREYQQRRTRVINALRARRTTNNSNGQSMNHVASFNFTNLSRYQLPNFEVFGRQNMFNLPNLRDVQLSYHRSQQLSAQQPRLQRNTLPGSLGRNVDLNQFRSPPVSHLNFDEPLDTPYVPVQQRPGWINPQTNIPQRPLFFSGRSLVNGFPNRTPTLPIVNSLPQPPARAVSDFFDRRMMEGARVSLPDALSAPRPPAQELANLRQSVSTALEATRNLLNSVEVLQPELAFVFNSLNDIAPWN